MVLIYCYDAYCGWCYAFSQIMKQVEEAYKGKLDVDVLSGGMILPEEPIHISATADYIRKAYKNVEDMSGVKFGNDYLWHIFNPDESDWYPNSEKPAIALCVFKTYYPDKALAFASDMQYALHFEGRDLTDDEAYRHLLEKYNIPAEAFYQKLKEPEFREAAYYEFTLVKQLQVKGYPAVLLQVDDLKFYLIANGYTSLENMKARIDGVLNELNK